MWSEINCNRSIEIGFIFMVYLLHDFDVDSAIYVSFTKSATFVVAFFFLLSIQFSWIRCSIATVKWYFVQMHTNTTHGHRDEREYAKKGKMLAYPIYVDNVHWAVCCTCYVNSKLDHNLCDFFVSPDKYKYWQCYYPESTP